MIRFLYLLSLSLLAIGPTQGFAEGDLAAAMNVESSLAVALTTESINISLLKDVGFDQGFSSQVASKLSANPLDKNTESVLGKLISVAPIAPVRALWPISGAFPSAFYLIGARGGEDWKLKDGEGITEVLHWPLFKGDGKYWLVFFHPLVDVTEVVPNRPEMKAAWSVFSEQIAEPNQLFRVQGDKLAYPVSLWGKDEPNEPPVLSLIFVLEMIRLKQLIDQKGFSTQPSRKLNSAFTEDEIRNLKLVTKRGKSVLRELRKFFIQPKHPAVNGQWCGYSEWSECSAQCGGGTQERVQADCSCPAPAYGGAGCPTPNTEIQSCNEHACGSVCGDGICQEEEDYTSCPNDCEDDRSSLEIVVAALINFAGGDSSFDDVNHLSEDQKDTLQASLEHLQRNKFAVINNQVQMMGEYDDAGEYRAHYQLGVNVVKGDMESPQYVDKNGTIIQREGPKLYLNLFEPPPL